WLRLPALAEALLPGRPAAARVAAVLRAPLRDGRAQQLLLPAAQQGGLSRVARAGPRRVRVRREGQPLSHAPQAAEGAGAAARSAAAPRAPARPDAGAAALPAPG